MSRAKTSRAIEIRPADLPAEAGLVDALIREYAASLEFDLAFQGLEGELASLAVMYGPPAGCFLLARVREAGREPAVAGGAGLRELSPGAEGPICEMKRLYVRPAHRGLGLGRRLAEGLLERARGLGYARMRLDTVPGMDRAQGLYGTLGFREIAAYCPNPVAGARYMELDLNSAGT